MAVVQKLDDEERRRGYEWFLDDVALVGIQRWAARLTIRLASDAAGSAIQIRSRERLRLGDWHHVALTYDGSGRAAGLHLYVNGERFDTEVVRDALDGSFKTAAPLRVGSKALGKPFIGQIDDLRLYDRALTPEQIAQLAIHYRVRAILSGVVGKPSRDEVQYAREYFLTHEAPEALRTAYAELKALRVQREELDRTIPTAMVMAEMNKPRDSFVLARGDYRNQTEKVTPGVPSMLPPLAEGAPLNRLTLAKWLVQPEHPLTARVAVNRYWQMYFGIRHRENAGGLRGTGRAAGPSRAARLAGDRVRAHGLGRSRACSG